MGHALVCVCEGAGEAIDEGAQAPNTRHLCPVYQALCYRNEWMVCSTPGSVGVDTVMGQLWVPCVAFNFQRCSIWRVESSPLPSLAPAQSILIRQ